MKINLKEIKKGLKKTKATVDKAREDYNEGQRKKQGEEELTRLRKIAEAERELEIEEQKYKLRKLKVDIQQKKETLKKPSTTIKVLTILGKGALEAGKVLNSQRTKKRPRTRRRRRRRSRGRYR